MKPSNYLIIALLSLGANAAAQTSSTTITTPSVTTPSTSTSPSATSAAATTNTSTLGSTQEDPNQPRLRIKYLGIVKGPSLNSTNFSQALNNGGAPGEVEHRLKLLIQKNDRFDFGVETRIRNVLASSGFSVLNGDYRLLANFKHVYRNDLIDLSLIPRLKLPTSDSSIKNGLIMAPELIANLDIAPKSSRFSFNTGLVYQQDFYKGTAPTTVLTTDVNPWFETDYQITEKVSAMISWWPDLAITGHNANTLSNDSNEIDVGANWEFLKGWTASPFIAIEPVGMNASGASTATKNMQFNVYVSGAFL